MADGTIEVWRGGVNAWQCDQMGHLNVRFYVAHAMEGLVALAAALGLPRAFAPAATSTLIVRGHHIRFLKESRTGDALHMRAGLLSIGVDEAVALQIMSHSDSDEPAAVFQTRLVHAKADDGHVFPWSAAARERAGLLMTRVPDGLGPRSLDPEADIAPISLPHAESLGLSLHGSGAFGPDECDAFGRVAPQAIMARISDGAAQSVASTRRDVGDIGAGAGKVGMAVVEHRLTYFDHPRAGGRFDVRTGLVSADRKLLRFAHWMFDPDTGRPWARADAALVVFDLEARRSMTLPDAALAALRARVVAGLSD